MSLVTILILLAIALLALLLVRPLIEILFALLLLLFVACCYIFAGVLWVIQSVGELYRRFIYRR